MALPHLNWRMLEFYQIDPNVNCPQNWHFRLIDVNQHSGGKCIKHSVNKPWTNFASDFVPRVQPDQPFERPHGEADSQERSLKEYFRLSDGKFHHDDFQANCCKSLRSDCLRAKHGEGIFCNCAYLSFLPSLFLEGGGHFANFLWVGEDAICLFLRSVLCVSFVEEYQHSWLAGNPEFAPVGSFRSWRKIKNKEPGDWDEEEKAKTKTNGKT